MRQVTTDCSIFFRSKAYCYETLLATWQRFVVGQGKAVELSGRKVVFGDHTLAVKDGRKMPGVVSLHESSETQSKPDYFRSQCWGCIGLLLGSFPACFLAPAFWVCCPLQLQIQQGWQHLGVTEDGGEKNPSSWPSVWSLWPSCLPSAITALVIWCWMRFFRWAASFGCANIIPLSIKNRGLKC